MKHSSILWRILPIIMLLGQLSFSQILNYEKEQERMVSVPGSPEAQAFVKYGNTSVSMYSGTPNISVPIYTIKGRELNLPVNITYDASGVKVSQLAAGAGLNWNLNAGGRVTRITNGLVDDLINQVGGTAYESVYSTNTDIQVGTYNTGKDIRQLISDYLNPPDEFTSEANARIYFEFLKEVSDNELDTQPDYFSFNAAGFSGHIVYDLEEEEFVCLNNPRVKVEADFNGGDYIKKWTITTDNGTVLVFDKAEETKVIKDGSFGVTSQYYQTYNSSWLLTKITSPNTLDVYEFTYTDLGLSNTQPDILITTVFNDLDHDSPDGANATNKVTNDINTQIEQQILTEIKLNTKTVIAINYKSRNDFDLDSAIDNIQIKKPNDSILKKYVLNHSYFEKSGASNDYDRRLKLDSITIQSSASNTLSSYAFEYFDPQNFPARDSKAQDYLGLYNGATTNSVLYPEVTIDGTTFAGADRDPDFDSAKKGTLKKITYPTKGYTEFTFEPHKTPYTADDLSASVQDVTYLSTSLSSNGGNDTTCGTCCLDQYGTAPEIKTVAFNITEAGNYEVNMTNTGSSDIQAYLHQRSLVQNMGTETYDSVIDQSNCNELFKNLIWSNYYDNDGDFKYMTPGTYQATLIKPGTGTLTFKVHREETSNQTVGTGEVARAGIRIATIKDYDHDDELITEKKYQYTTNIGGGTSSGDMLFEPVFYTTSTYMLYNSSIPDQTRNIDSGMNDDLTSMARQNSWSGGDRPHIAYDRVYEIQKATGQDNGYIEHNFNLGWYNGVYNVGVAPGVNLYRNDYEIGKERETVVYNDVDVAVQSDSITYQNPNYFGNSTIYTKNNFKNTFSFVRIYYDTGTSKWRYSIEEGVYSGFSASPTMAIDASASGQQYPVKPSTCGTNGEDCLPMGYAPLSTLQTYAQGRIGGLLSKKSISYDGSTDIVQIVDNTYDTSDNYQLRKTETTNSKGETTSTEYKYPEDFTTSPYPDMVTDGQLTQVVETKTYNGTNLLFTQQSSHDKLGNVFVVDGISTAKGTQSLEERIEFTKYVDGNLVEVKQVGGTTTAYIWGYNKQYVVAKLENVGYNSISTTTISDIQTKANNDDDTCSPGGNCDEETLRVALNGLRTAHPDAMITTYTYDPLVGVTSMTDPNGQTVTYHYDEFNRLEYVKDKNAKILSQNQYHYKGQ